MTEEEIEDWKKMFENAEKIMLQMYRLDEIVPVQFNLSNSWVLAHDSFVQDRDAPTTGTLDASPSEFTDVEGLKRVIGNYAICKQTAEQLKSLQDWIRTSQKEVGDNKDGG
ncbi:MAG: hypothetical protein EBU08_14990 [Micrococcales bacterium]|nr:hypothetical protein [Micrococcales bacterium]